MTEREAVSLLKRAGFLKPLVRKTVGKDMPCIAPTQIAENTVVVEHLTVHAPGGGSGAVGDQSGSGLFRNNGEKLGFP